MCGECVVDLWCAAYVSIITASSPVKYQNPTIMVLFKTQAREYRHCRTILKAMRFERHGIQQQILEQPHVPAERFIPMVRVNGCNDSYGHGRGQLHKRSNRQ